MAARGKERVQISCRVTLETKAQLDAAMAASGRSQGQEIEMRLQQSLMGEDDPDLAEFERWLIGAFRQGLQRGAAARGIQRQKKDKWLADRDAYEAACYRILDYLAMAHPDGEFLEVRMKPWKATTEVDMRRMFNEMIGRGSPVKISRGGDNK